MGFFDNFLKNPLSILSPAQGLADTVAPGVNTGIMAGMAGAVLPGVADIYNVYSQQQTNDRMMSQSERMFQTSREDQNTAVQRRAADMKAAGINPLLAAGDAAGVSQGSTPGLTAPQMRGPTVTEAISLNEMLKNNAADRRLKNAQARSTEQNVNLLAPAEETAKSGNTLLESGKKFLKDFWNDRTQKDQQGFKTIQKPIKRNPNNPNTHDPNAPWRMR